jgi:arginyl-tRNA--protein-N-Asp/Glu arginylyltransferase
MQIKIKQVYGSQEDTDLQIVKLTLDGKFTDAEALENGWLIYDNKWYTCRSSRIDVNKFDKKPKPIKGYEFVYKDKFVYDDEIKTVYNKYTTMKQFKKHYKIDSDLDRSSVIKVYHNGNIVAFTKFLKYDSALESQFTAWDYSDPKASIGRKIVEREVDICKSLGFKYLYIGAAYGIGSKYKTEYNGFEWWTGDKWSTDKEEILNILQRDSEIDSLEKLEHAFI